MAEINVTLSQIQSQNVDTVTYNEDDVNLLNGNLILRQFGLTNDYIEQVNPDAINISDDLPVDEINGEVIQGGISVKRLIKGEDITPVLEKMKDKPYIVNLAHGIDKTTPVENVKNFVNAVKDFRNNLAEVDNNL